MKKIVVLTFILACGINATVCAMENRLSLGFGYGNFFEKSADNGVNIKQYMGAPGLDLHFYHLWDNMGFFHHYSFQFPNTLSSNVDGYEYFFRFNFMIGPAYKITFTEKIDMILGIGFSLGPTTGKLHDMAFRQFGIGLGGDIGVSFFLNRRAYVNIGGNFSYHFANVTSIATGRYKVDDDGDRDEIRDTKWSRNYSMFGIKPFIRFGIRL